MLALCYRGRVLDRFFLRSPNNLKTREDLSEDYRNCTDLGTYGSNGDL